MDKNYYTIMGVEANASEQEIKTAYRRLARKFHPDLNKDPNAEERFKEMGEAYEVLKDPKKRTEYDQYLKNKEFHNQRQQQPNQHHQSYQYQEQNSSFDGAEFDSDFFESLFGHARQPHKPRSGQDYHGSISITLEEAFLGTVKNIQLPSKESTKKESQTLSVKIPAGIKSGQKIRLTGQGASGAHGAPSGDLFITVEVQKHHLFEVKENDIYLTLPITPWEAALGATIVVPTLSGKVDLKIPPNSQGGQKLRLKNRGLPATPAGDQYLLLKIVTPVAQSEEQKALYQKMSELMPFNPRAALGV